MMHIVFKQQHTTTQVLYMSINTKARTVNRLDYAHRE